MNNETAPKLTLTVIKFYILFERSELNEIAESNASKNGIMQFDFSNDAKKLEFIILDDGDKTIIPVAIIKN